MKHLWLGLLLLASPAFATVDAYDYDAFWLWSGVVPQPVLKQARTLYILQGQINSTRRHPERGVQFIAQGMSVPRIRQGQVWVVYRAHTLRWPEPVYTKLLGQVQRWKTAGNPVVGIQIDFDARTQYLHEYADFLKDLRQRLPKDLRLSITGLMDWSSNADPAAIAQLKGVVDEVVVQTYQGRHSIPDYAAYLPRMNRLGLPFKIGLIQGGDWQEPEYLKESEWFGGYVVFLQNP
ncbi:hypothetical protein H097_00095 [Pseudomonas sp. FH4]|uniref:DUF3142 domain-containing protein n=2 Tax=Pseudomonas TaxID=286 RepID=A0A5B2UQP6_9PSED|nr:MULTISPECIES: DUF3142 domain-containing protein [Pseudomonas fluorescens group]ETK21431.1 hypothetical protein H097_00095 [Pseudomonas sp. FH4]KAA2229011.1 DUF3142 domain-containing protein [Pseudomonas brenneri]MBF8004735.1 DUF3142 domain-containing protein [Pseudomonas brenneri]TWR76381.1 DUF3142 domain-containing protein [Pseudomonas brenneri]WJM91738.1 DUF3142 domain-containing protein [Pseudomonas brenneri]